MSEQSRISVKELVARRKAGYALEAPFYTSAEIFRVDMDVIFGRHWIFVGLDPDVPEAGDAMVVNIGPSSVIIVRGDDEEVRAFHNVCRHRGARILPEGKAIIGNVVCPYHSWTYGLEGGLKFAEHMGPGFDPTCHGLKPVALRSVSGLLFICLSDDPPADIDEMAAAMAPYLAPHDIRNTRVAFQSDLIEDGNWKLTMENNRECYHCAPNHPELTIPLFAYGFGFAPDALDEEGRREADRYAKLMRAAHARWEAEGLPSREIEHLADRATGFRTERLPIDQSGESQTMDTRAACRVALGGLTDKAIGGLSFWTQPNSWHHFMGDHIVSFSAIPIDEGHTLVRTKWLVHKDAVEGVDYDLQRLTEVWEATNRQDADLVAIGQQGATDPAYEAGPYSPYTEGLVEKFAAWYIDRLAASLP
ncbi:aromatic ring-hydroxylating oxygenase subunit alpha [Gluconacetobacter johannae]|uniref:Aromatic ring-hydroxylating dioxygenase subunit alpha n=1 Tax=Gluconacetobacter johannae TaxID=112140 RepID=A0A7W4P3X1_9PROT|nr:aromatic ring-hydroxylating dioxygenase subunit alpha [Gluconacetobacter johannae]MBB2176294.1 aromatic ring-hydroxylating dioxygenase subunit alpha [Gluconacetobacter johannae]